MKKTECLAMILAGGRGSRLGVLTKNLAKPGVLFGGKYRIIDFPLSNCRNSGIDTVGILTQYQPLELNWYAGNGASCDLDADNGGTYVLPPYESDNSAFDKYLGTADAIYQNLNFIDKVDPEYVLILSGDHIYSMDYAAMLANHRKHNAGCTVSTMRVPMSDASRFGIMNTDSSMRIVEFEEKPAHPKSNLASMGIYIFNKDVLKKYLRADARKKESAHDFGKNVIPDMLASGVPVYAYAFEGYWKDVGTIDSLWQANMDLLADDPPLNLNSSDWRILSGAQVLPPHYIGTKGSTRSSLIGEGSYVNGEVYSSVIFYDVVIEEGAQVRNAVIMPGTVVEKGAVVDRYIVGERCRIKAGARLTSDGEIGVLGSDETYGETKKGADK